MHSPVAATLALSKAEVSVKLLVIGSAKPVLDTVTSFNASLDTLDVPLTVTATVWNTVSSASRVSKVAWFTGS
jgi:hypothetical protein